MIFVCGVQHEWDVWGPPDHERAGHWVCGDDQGAHAASTRVQGGYQWWKQRKQDELHCQPPGNICHTDNHRYLGEEKEVIKKVDSTVTNLNVTNLFRFNNLKLVQFTIVIAFHCTCIKSSLVQVE